MTSTDAAADAAGPAVQDPDPTRRGTFTLLSKEETEAPASWSRRRGCSRSVGVVCCICCMSVALVVCAVIHGLDRTSCAHRIGTAVHCHDPADPIAAVHHGTSPSILSAAKVPGKSTTAPSLNSGAVFPTAIIIGAQKAATTSLFHALATEHPGFCGPDDGFAIPGSVPKEVHHFDIGCGSLFGMRTSGKRRGTCADYGEGWAKAHAHQYSAHFSVHPRRERTCQLYAEATPAYLLDLYAPARLVATLPPTMLIKTRLIAVLREPVARDFSMFRMLRDHFWTKESPFSQFWRPPQDVIEADPALQYITWTRWRLLREELQPYSTALSYGRYARQLKAYLASFDSMQLFVVNMPTLFGEAYPGIMAAIASFLGLANVWGPKSALPRTNIRTVDKPGPAICANLTRYFAPHNHELYVLLDGLWTNHRSPPTQPRFGRFEPSPCTAE